MEHVQCGEVPSLSENKQNNYLLGTLIYRGYAAISVRGCIPPPPFGGTPTVMPKHVLCARFCFQKRLVINFSRGIASIVDCYLSYFICVDVYASACLSFFYLVCCSTDEMFWIISRIETKKKKKSYLVPCSLYSIVPSCP